MRIVRFRPAGTEADRVGAWHDDRIHDLSDRFPRLPELLAELTRQGEQWLAATLGDAAASYPLEEVTLAAPLERGNKVLCVALNYRDHAHESGVVPPERPIFFMKTWESVIGPYDEIQGGHQTSFLDYEAELAVVVGAPATAVPPERAYAHIAGFTLVNDVSARDLLKVRIGDRRVNDYFSAKCLDRATPIGAAVVTAAEFGDPMAVRISATLNGELVQDAPTAEMVVPVAELLAYASRRATLNPGDIIATGTPAGVGKARGRPLRDGDEVTVAGGAVPPLHNRVRMG